MRLKNYPCCPAAVRKPPIHALRTVTEIVITLFILWFHKQIKIIKEEENKMKKLLAIAIIAVMTLGLFAVSVNAASDDIVVDLSGATGNIDVKVEGGKVICTTTGGDPWVSIPVDNIDTSVYNYFTVKYSATKEVGSNNTYLMDTSVNPGYSGTAGTWAPHGMAGTADGAAHTKTYDIAADFPTMAGTTLTGVRFTCCNDMDGVFTVESLVFSKAAPSETEEPAGSSLLNKCFDEGYAADGVGRAKGWAHIANGTIGEFGYRIDDGKNVFDASYAASRPDVQEAFGVDATVADGFEMTIDISKVAKGDHTITFVVKASDGNVFDMGSYDFTSTYEGPDENPGTADASVIAIATVACIALAGVVIAKKVR
jgi:hypothetical protein